MNYIHMSLRDSVRQINLGPLYVPEILFVKDLLSLRLTKLIYILESIRGKGAVYSKSV